jgi:MFS family permease
VAGPGRQHGNSFSASFACAVVEKEAGVQARSASAAPARAGLVLATLILAAGIANINLAVANVALPDIGKAFQASQSALDLVAVGYSLGLAASVLYLGAVGDRYGRKLLLAAGMALSVPACLLAAYAPSAGVLVAEPAALPE